MRPKARSSRVSGWQGLCSREPPWGAAGRCAVRSARHTQRRWAGDQRSRRQPHPFQLTAAEAELSRSQIATLNGGRGHNIKYLPHAFTEHGAIQAANVLNSPRAVAMGVYVVRAFVHLRELLSSNRELARRFAQLETRLDKKLTEHDRAIGAILSAIRELMQPKVPVPKRRPIGFTADLEEKL